MGTREAAEETGLHLDAEDLAFSSVIHRMEEEERVDFFVHVLRWRGEPVNSEPDKCDDLRWVNINELPANLIPYVKQGIQNHRAGIAFYEFGW